MSADALPLLLEVQDLDQVRKDHPTAILVDVSICRWISQTTHPEALFCAFSYTPVAGFVKLFFTLKTVSP